MNECVVHFTNGRRLCGPTYDANAGGCHYLAVANADGQELAHSTFEQWQTDPIGEMSRIAGALTGGRPIADEGWLPDDDTREDYGDGYGPECVAQATDNDLEIRFPAHPDEVGYVRLTVEGSECSYWVYDEWAEDPELVMGALLGQLSSGSVSPDSRG
jgi:hypothetical protein